MKTIRYSSLLTILLFAFAFTTAQPIEKTLIKSFNLEGNDYIELDLDGQVEIRDWNNSIMRIHVTVGIETGSNAMLKSLVTAGRYNLKASETDQGLDIAAPGLDRKITVRGNELKEVITYIVYKPENVTIHLKNEASTSQLAVSDPSNM